MHFLYPRWFMIPTILRQWPWWNSYFVWLWFLLRGVSSWGLPCCLFSFFFCHVQHCDHFTCGRERSIRFSCICMFILHALLFVFFLLVSGCGCDLWLWHSLDFSFNFLSLLGTIISGSLVRMRRCWETEKSGMCCVAQNFAGDMAVYTESHTALQ